MYCPTCGSEIEEMIEYNGAKVCPECGCIVEMIKASTVKKPEKFNKLKIATVLAVIGIVLGVAYLPKDIIDMINILGFGSLSVRYIGRLVAIMTFMALTILMVVVQKKKNSKKACVLLLVCVPFCAAYYVWELIDLMGIIVDVFESSSKDFLISYITLMISFITIICFFVFIAMFTFLRKKVYGVVLHIAGVLYLTNELVRFSFVVRQDLSGLLLLVLNISLVFSVYMSVLYGIENEKEVETDVGKKNMV